MSTLPPLNNWYLAAYSRKVKKSEVIGLKILGQSIAFYRDSKNSVRAVQDSCPHKKLPLSMGVFKNNKLTCRYHGWQFSDQGDLEKVPCKGLNEKVVDFKLTSYPIVEKDDWVWIWMDLSSEPDHQPTDYPLEKGPFWFEFENVMQAPIDTILENGLDCSHTGFAHEGLFRSDPTNEVEAIVEKTPTGVKVETRGEAREKKRDFMSFLTSGSEVYHTDEYIAPHTVFVDYRVGKSQVITILICTPIDEKTTMVFTRMNTQFPMFNSLVGRVVKNITGKVIKQDKEILEGQAKNVVLGQRQGFRFTQADGPTTIFFKAFDQVCEGKDLWGGKYGKKSYFYKL